MRTAMIIVAVVCLSIVVAISDKSPQQSPQQAMVAIVR